MPSTKKASSCGRAAVLERQHGDRRAGVASDDAAGVVRCRRLRSASGGFARVLVAPEEAAAEQEQQREDRELGAADALLAAVAVVPGEDQDDGQADQQCEDRELAGAGAASRRRR